MATRGVPVQGLVTWQDQHQRQQQLGDQEQQQEQGSTAADEVRTVVWWREPGLVGIRLPSYLLTYPLPTHPHTINK